VVAVVAVLVHGAVYPEPPPEKQAEPAAAPPRPPLRPDVEKAPLAYASDYWLQLGEESRRRLVQIGRRGSPGVLVAPGLALAAAEAAEEHFIARWEEELSQRARQPDGPPRRGSSASEPSAHEAAEGNASELETTETLPKLLGVDGELGLALFEIPYAGQAFTAAQPATQRPGAQFAAISFTTNAGLLVSPGFLMASPFSSEPRAGVPQLETSLTWLSRSEIAALVNLDGDLLGLAVPTAKGLRTWPVETVYEAVDRLQAGGLCRAIEVSDLAEETRRVLDWGRGVLIERVRADSFQPEPSLRSGDLLVEWDGKAVETAAEFHELYDTQAPGELVSYQVTRGARRLRGRTRMPGVDCRPVSAPAEFFVRLGVILRWEPRPDREQSASWHVLGLREDGPAAQAGLQRDDWIAAIQGRPIDRPGGMRLFENFERRPEPLVLTILRRDRVQLVTVSPPENDSRTSLTSATPMYAAAIPR
jgi:S1-C subfamily serine protease